jgi:ankyrin repeat protein
MCEKLIFLGANIHATNKYGLNCLHIAAQGDQASTMYLFYKIYGIALTKQDLRGSTPMHWACYSSSEISILYLLSWLTGEQMAIKDNDGFTPIHLAVLNSEGNPSGSRPVKALILKGSPTNLLDNQGHTPFDLTENIIN